MCREGRSECITNATQEELYLKIWFLSKFKKEKKKKVILELEKAMRQMKSYHAVIQKLDGGCN